MGKNKSNNLAVCIVCGILTAFGIVANIISLVTRGKSIRMINDVIDLLVSALIGYYAFSGYRKPHGNLLKYIILIFAVTRLFSVYRYAQLGNPWQTVNRTIIIGLCCYVAGRLHKVKQNIILLSFVIILKLVPTVVNLANAITTIGAFTPIIILIDIFVAYVLRYKEHKEAGLMDAGK